MVRASKRFASIGAKTVVQPATKSIATSVFFTFRLQQYVSKYQLGPWLVTETASNNTAKKLIHPTELGKMKYSA